MSPPNAKALATKERVTKTPHSRRLDSLQQAANRWEALSSAPLAKRGSGRKRTAKPDRKDKPRKERRKGNPSNYQDSNQDKEALHRPAISKP